MTLEISAEDRLGADWRAESDAWITEALAARGVVATGPVQTVRVRAWSIVRRLETSAGRVWFKANVPTNGFEAAVVEALADRVPELVVPPLAVDRERGWLLGPDGGTILREVAADRPEPARWVELLRTYAGLQRAVAPHGDRLVGLGLPDLRPDRMPGALAGLLADPTVRLAEPRRAALVALLPEYDRWCAELGADGLPASIQHDDLHDGNVFVGTGGMRFFDWGDACLAHPFGTLLVALNVAADQLGSDPAGPELARLRDAYLEPWTDLCDRTGLLRSVRLALRVAKVGRAVSWQRALRGATLPQWQRALGGPALIAPEHTTAPAAWLDTLTEPDILPPGNG
ncbi:phosphotransferase family protein [Plantactinospora endophytica]|uniref:Phosphotransferase n=1 Tax=Plantactinospora endophytica TaxID=673535 RepID=A0ABQ4DXC1_9ACTN|nr:phosphotransferase [Plantactinospora endophytica]GIG87086.1 phosphotransferase [Plantactinospora endophytica]